ncbi:MAG TPA: hypothetical protein PK252_02785 [Bacteroidales bacterium]|nr:hypothetical protein [Bacteroidales bacterium]
MEKTFKYQVFGLNIISEIELPIPEKSFDTAQVEIRFGETPFTLGGEARRGVVYEALPNAVLIKVFDIARFHIVDGSAIIVQPLEKYDNKSAVAFIMGSVFASLLYQRGIMPLHASALEYKGKIIVICGVSGAGKSTLALGLAKQGFRIICDDIVPIYFQNGLPMASSGFNQSKIWKDTAAIMDISVEPLVKVREEIDKFYYEAENVLLTNEPLSVKHIFILSATNKENLETKNIEGKDKFLVLRNHLFRKQIAFSMGLEARLFGSLAKLAASVPVTKIERPTKGFSLEIPQNSILQILDL